MLGWRSGPDAPGLDLRGVFVGSEGTMGIATRIAVRLMPDPPEIRTLLADFTAIDDAAGAVSAVIAAGIVPAAMEMMDARATQAVEDFVGAGLPRDADAVLLVEVSGLIDGVTAHTEAIDRICRAHGARDVRIAIDAGRAGAALEGAQVGVRRGRPHRARLLPARRRGSPDHASSRSCARPTRSASATAS